MARMMKAGPGEQLLVDDFFAPERPFFSRMGIEARDPDPGGWNIEKITQSLCRDPDGFSQE